MNTDAVKKYFVKKKGARFVANLKRWLRQKKVSRWTENPNGRSMQKRETYKKNEKMIILIG